MCVVSAVFDHFEKRIPTGDDWFVPNPYPVNPYPVLPSGGVITVTSTPTHVIISAEEAAAIRALIAEFKEALAAARVVDKALGQPDCEDPQKAKLEDRVAALEKRLAAIAGAAAQP